MSTNSKSDHNKLFQLYKNSFVYLCFILMLFISRWVRNLFLNSIYSDTKCIFILKTLCIHLQQLRQGNEYFLFTLTIFRIINEIAPKNNIMKPTVAKESCGSQKVEIAMTMFSQLYN